MCRKIVWCYVFILTLLDFTINTKLSAQGKSHGVTVHDSLIEGITFQEWGKDSVEDVSDGAGAGASGGGRAMAAGVLLLSPPSLNFGAAQLATPHTLVVTITNTANTTMHLASVAGTTPDFHASFFDAKTLAPQANTSFSVVYLGRREGPVSAHLYIHTSLGVHKYSVSAVGVASDWGVWPLVGVRVPLNATVEPLLTMYNPTDHTIQVSEVYSSGSWLGLQLPDGGAAAPRQAWSVPARSSAPLVRLKIALHHVHHTHQHHTHTAYVRIKANITGGGLIVCVEARPAPPGEFATPVQLRLRTRGSEDPADVVDISAGNSANVGVSVEASVWAARCSPTPYAPQAPSTHNGDSKFTANGNGVKSDGVYVSLVRSYLEPHQHLTRTAQLTLDYAKMWAGYSEKGESTASAGAWCGGWVVLGRAAVPYSVRLLPGTLRLTPSALHIITSNREEWSSTREVTIHNDFPVPVHIVGIDYDDDVDKYLQIDSPVPMTIAGGSSGVVARVRLRGEASSPPASLAARLLLRTNLTEYTLPVYVYSGQLDIEWEWPNSADGTLRLGSVGASSTRHVRARLHNRGPLALCVRELAVSLPGAQVVLPDPPPPAPLAAEQLSARCVEAGQFAWAWLTVVAPARAGAQSGHVLVRAAPPHAPAPAHPAPAAPAASADVLLTVHHGRVSAHGLTLAKAAPYAWSTAALILESTMDLTMRVQSVTIPPDNPALMFQALAEPSTGEVTSGRHTVGTIVYAAEKLCEPDCYTGLDVNTTEGEAWLSRSASPGEESLRVDVTQQAARYALYLRRGRANISLHLHTDHVVQIPVSGVVNAWWPRLAASSGDAGLAGVGGSLPLRIRVRNPSHSHSVLLQPVLAGPLESLASSSESPVCRTEKCVPALDAFRLVEWRATRGAVSTWRDVPPDPAEASADSPPAPPAPDDLPSDPRNASDALPLLLLAPDAEIELKLTFAPKEAAALTAYLYLRNNLTIVEGVQLSGRGAYPSFEIGGRRPGTNSPLLFEVSECGAGGAGGAVARSVVVRNTGRVRVRLRDWRVAGDACAARGFTLAPCAALTLAPNESRALSLAFAPDWTLARVAAPLTLRSDLGRAAFPLAAAVPAHVLARCAAAAPRPPWEGALRAAGSLLALAALALVLAAAALDAERELRRARAARPPPAPRQPLDLRALADVAQTVSPPVVRRPVGRRRPRRHPVDQPDPTAERHAFERWRLDVLNRRDDDTERSSEENELAHTETNTDETATLLENRDEERKDEPLVCSNDGYEADPETEDRPVGSGDDEDAASTGSGSASASSSSPTRDVDEPEESEECSHEPSRPRVDPAPVTPARVVNTSTTPDTSVRPTRPRRSDTNDTPRRTDRNKSFDNSEHGSRSRPNNTKHHTKKDKGSKRRERIPTSPPRSPARVVEARGAASGAGGGAAGGALRWGESWSSVVAARPAPAHPAHPAPLAPIGSDVRRRADVVLPPPPVQPPHPSPSDNSLFYFNGDTTHTPPRDVDFTWRPQPQLERPVFSTPRDYLDEPNVVGNNSYRLNSVWGASLEPRPAAAAWLWGGLGSETGVRPPPGFGVPPRPVRSYDPFRSLASIWAPGALDWRADTPPPPSPDEQHK